MNPKVSIIIPVYNAEKYIEDCINSVLHQTFKDVEIILVDDGSTDNCPAICDKYAHNEDAITVIHQKNSGPSVARNEGLFIAKGEYIIFIDSDDFWLHEDDLATLLHHPALNDPSFVLLEFNRVRFIPSTNSFVKFPEFPPSLTIVQDTNNVIIELLKNGLFPMSPCTKLIKRDFLINNNITFIKGIISEDSPWYMEILRRSTRGIVFYNFYMYGNRSEIATSRSSTFSEKKIKDILWILEYDITKINESELPNEVKEALMSSLAYKYILIQVLSYSNIKQLNPLYIQKIKDYEWILKYDLHPKVKKVNILIKILGMPISMKLLNIYMNNRDAIKKHL